jgi:hypothetical protein
VHGAWLGNDLIACCRHVELAAGLAWVDLVDQHGNALHLDDAGAARANTIVTLRDKYSVIAIST